MSYAKCKVIVVDDQSTSRQWVRRALYEGEEFDIVGYANNSAEALRVVEKLLPDLVLMDVHLGEKSGFETTVVLKAKYPKIQVVLLSMDNDTAYFRLAEQLGALGFIPKCDFNLNALRQIWKPTRMDHKLL